MNRFVDKYSSKLFGVISGFDRLVFKGTLRPLSYTAGMMNFLYEKGVLLKDFGSYVDQVSEQLKEASPQEAERLGRTNRSLGSSQLCKEPIAQKIAKKEGIDEGLICLLRTVESCMSYDIYRNREAQRLDLIKRQRKCLWIYHYGIDPRWGFMSARIQTWFPFDIYLCLNGREWLGGTADGSGGNRLPPRRELLGVDRGSPGGPAFDEQATAHELADAAAAGCTHAQSCTPADLSGPCDRVVLDGASKRVGDGLDVSLRRGACRDVSCAGTGRDGALLQSRGDALPGQASARKLHRGRWSATGASGPKASGSSIG